MPNTTTRVGVEVHECADAFVIARPPGGGPHLLLTERSDYPGQWSLPGGHLDLGEDAVAAALRELGEETCLWLDRARVAYLVLPRRQVPDPRANPNIQYWTTPVRVDLDGGLPELCPDPAEVLCAEWVYARSYGTVCQHLDGLGGAVWSAHEPMLRELLA